MLAPLLKYFTYLKENLACNKLFVDQWCQLFCGNFFKCTSTDAVEFQEHFSSVEIKYLQKIDEVFKEKIASLLTHLISLTHAHTHSPSLSPSHTHKHTLSLSLSLSTKLSLSHTFLILHLQMILSL